MKKILALSVAILVALLVVWTRGNSVSGLPPRADLPDAAPSAERPTSRIDRLHVESRPKASGHLVQVVDERSIPISGALVIPVDYKQRLWWTTDDRGECLIDERLGESLRVHVLQVGFVGWMGSILTAAGGGTRVSLRQLARLEGVVVDSDGAAVSGAEVWLEYKRAEESERSYTLVPEDGMVARAPVHTDASGVFRVPVVVSDQAFKLVCTHPEFDKLELENERVECGKIGSKRIVLQAACGVAGQVPDVGDKAAVVTVSVSTWAEAPRSLNQTKKERVDPGGAFRFGGLRPGKALVSVVTQRFRSTSIATIEVELQRGRTVDVGLLTPEDSVISIACEVIPPAPSMKVELEATSLGGTGRVPIVPLQVVVSREEAEDYRMIGVRAGLVQVGGVVMDELVGNGFSDMTYPPVHNRIEHQSVSSVRFQLRKRPPPSRLTVNVDLPDHLNKPDTALRVWAQDARAVISMVSRPFKSPRMVSFGGCPAGVFSVFVVADGYFAEKHDVEVVEGKDTEVHLKEWKQAMSVSCDVVDAQGAPVPNATVAVVGPARCDGQLGELPILDDLRTDENGSVMLPMVGSGLPFGAVATSIVGRSAVVRINETTRERVRLVVH